MFRAVAAILGPVFGLILNVASSAQDFSIDDDGGRIQISERGQQVLDYTYKITSTGADQRQGGGFFHPIHGLYGEVLTGESPSNWSGPAGLHWSWSRLGADGKVIDLATGDGGRREFERILLKDSAGGKATVALQSVWLSGPDYRAQVLETIGFTVYPVLGGARNIDISVLVRSVATGPILLQGSIPGSGLGFIASPERSDWEFLGSGGISPSKGVPFLSPFMVCSYRDGRTASRSAVALFQDARNPGFAQPNWLVEAGDRVSAGVAESYKVELQPGDFIEFRYRLVLCHLDGPGSLLTEAYAQFMADGQRRQ